MSINQRKQVLCNFLVRLPPLTRPILGGQLVAVLNGFHSTLKFWLHDSMRNSNFLKKIINLNGQLDHYVLFSAHQNFYNFFID